MKIHLTAAQLGLALPEGTTIPVDLTPEQVLSINGYGAPYKPVAPPVPVDICQRINSWEDAKSILSNGGHYPFVAPNQYSSSSRYIIFPSERHAKSMLAFAQLSVIAEAYNRSAGEHRGELYTVASLKTGELYSVPCAAHEYQITFHISGHRDDCLKKFEHLWKDYWMID